ncbi:hypothetical protein ES708_17595 [subsurface metagenome]
MKLGRSIQTQIAAHKVEAAAHALSAITVDADKDWQGKSISNFKNLELITGGYVRLEDSLANNLEWSGIAFEGTAGEDLAQFQTVYRTNDDKYKKAKADDSATMPVIAMAVEAITNNATGLFILFGWIRNDGFTLTAGQPAYQSAATAGVVTTTIPPAATDQVQKVGIALTAKIAHFNPTYTVFVKSHYGDAVCSETEADNKIAADVPATIFAAGLVVEATGEAGQLLVKEPSNAALGDFQATPATGTFAQYVERVNDNDLNPTQYTSATVIEQYAEIDFGKLVKIDQWRQFGHDTNNENGEWKIEYYGPDLAWHNWVTGIPTRKTDWGSMTGGAEVICSKARLTCEVVDTGGIGSMIIELEVYHS